MKLFIGSQVDLCPLVVAIKNSSTKKETREIGTKLSLSCSWHDGENGTHGSLSRGAGIAGRCGANVAANAEDVITAISKHEKTGE